MARKLDPLGVELGRVDGARHLLEVDRQRPGCDLRGQRRRRGDRGDGGGDGDRVGRTRPEPDFLRSGDEADRSRGARIDDAGGILDGVGELARLVGRRDRDLDPGVAGVGDLERPGALGFAPRLARRVERQRPVHERSDGQDAAGRGGQGRVVGGGGGDDERVVPGRHAGRSRWLQDQRQRLGRLGEDARGGGRRLDPRRIQTLDPDGVFVDDIAGVVDRAAGGGRAARPGHQRGLAQFDAEPDRHPVILCLGGVESPSPPNPPSPRLRGKGG
ncbi:MAG: hypothetical protein AVDCRST_MAG73-717 [uncultured Thermomicrobiales bacterium]|uniref:Uncharacterized protein n=1 Tax=uncultured Thermomicrobiales bacterium TaxID=1645740 RepID=A0A6J4TRL7_9BACT|nr:MAG: hypothetical protein AVDCRST_MAG73-717 [uncultured Thermomicrobiales bacterium]